MKKRTVGIYARYDASEQTICAMFLARRVTECYRYVRWFTSSHIDGEDRRYKDFSYRWGKEVMEWRKQPASQRKKNLSVCDTFFFFEPEESILDNLPPKAVTAFVLDPRTWSDRVKLFAQRCKFTLLPCMSWIKRFPVCNLLENIHHWPFDPAIQCIARSDIDYTSAPCIFFPAYGMTPRERIFTEQVMRLTRKCVPNAKAAMGFFDATRPPDSEAGIDPAAEDWRMCRYLQNANWVVDLNTRPHHCIFPAFAGGYGSQWVGFDVTPNSDDINGARRHLITQPVIQEEEVHRTTRKGPRVTPDVEETTEQLVCFLQQTFHGDLDRNRNSGVWDIRRAEYLKTTNAVLQIKSRY